VNSPSIEQLQELPLPAPISYLPHTWGWLVLAGILLLTLAAWTALKIHRWRRNRYRREALARLDQLQQLEHLQQLDSTALREVPELLKRVALSIPQHPAVASLSGEAWQTFLQRSSTTRLPDDFAKQLATLAYAPEAALHNLDPHARAQLLSLSRHWVETHHVAA
jgi:hypothetical protein